VVTGAEEKPKTPATPEVAQTSASVIDSATPVPEPLTTVDHALSDTVVDSDIQADFTDDEVEAEVIDSFSTKIADLMARSI
jgi:hypothetical protein